MDWLENEIYYCIEELVTKKEAEKHSIRLASAIREKIRKRRPNESPLLNYNYALDAYDKSLGIGGDCRH